MPEKTETPPKGRSASTSDSTPDDIHRAFLAGYDRGFAEGQRFASEDMAREWIHALACDYTGLSLTTARARHGQGWADEIERQAVGA